MTALSPTRMGRVRKSRRRRQVVFRAALLLVLFAPCAHSEDYRFLYRFTPRTGFFEMGHSRQTSAGKLVSEFHELVHFQVSQEPDAGSPTLTARIVSLSNKGRPIEYYAGVTFQARISATGEISRHTFFGGQPQHRALMQAAAPAKGRDIFWMPAFPTAPLRVGDTFSHAVSTSGASGRRDYRLEEVRGNLARFRVSYSGSVSLAGLSGTETGQGQAVFDMEKGMWESLTLQIEGTGNQRGGISFSYRKTSSKEFRSYGGCDPATTGVDNANNMIDQALRQADNWLRNALTGWPGSGQDLYAVYRHFHCPNAMQQSRIGDNLRRAKEALARGAYMCLPASTRECRDGNFARFRNVENADPSTFRVEFCPRFFSGLTDHEQAGLLVSIAVRANGVSQSHTCSIRGSCYYNFLEPAEDIIGGNPFAYAAFVRELSGWTPPTQPGHVPCLPSLTNDFIRVRGGASATDPSSVQHYEGDAYQILEDRVTGDRFIRHNNLEGADHYLYEELRDGYTMRYYLPADR